MDTAMIEGRPDGKDLARKDVIYEANDGRHRSKQRSKQLDKIYIQGGMKRSIDDLTDIRIGKNKNSYLMQHAMRTASLRDHL